MEIRKASIKDSEPLLKLIQEVTNNPNEAQDRVYRFVELGSNSRLILTIRDNSKLMGYVGINELDDDMDIGRSVDLRNYSRLVFLGISLDYRLNGFGSMLVRVCEKLSSKWNKSGVCLECSGDVLPFFTKNQYKISRKYPGRRRYRYVMSKEF